MEHIAFIPADSRIPDHSIWTHMAMSSALVGCVDGSKGNMDFILFQFGPVQEFIAQARSTRDLWSGSYLLSWLSAHAMKAITDDFGPDAVVFPSLRNNGIFDAMYKDDVYSKRFSSGGGKSETTWQRICEEKKKDNRDEQLAAWLLNPTLPNRFMAIVPRGRGEEYAKKAEKSLRKELSGIADDVWGWVKGEALPNLKKSDFAKYGWSEGEIASWESAFRAQVEAFPRITYAVQPYLSREEALAEAEKYSPDVCKRIKEILDIAESAIPSGDRDGRYYDGGRLGNEGVLWSAHVELVNAKLAARRNTRDFAQWKAAEDDGGKAKDSLSGVEEAIGDDKFWEGLASFYGKTLFRAKSHKYGAMNLIKRVWCFPERKDDFLLKRSLGIKPKDIDKALRFDSTQEIAGNDKDEKYVAVIAMDGDNMGKWMSGENALSLQKCLAPKAKEYLGTLGVGDGVKRLVTPSYHLQFSEALANFSTVKAEEIVSKSGGTLVYAGGDDVLAIVPIKRAIRCAAALRDAFRTDFEGGRLYPGKKCDVSCGIAYGSTRAPLQMLVKEAQRAEHTAKNKYGRGALAITLYKRSGEIIEWGTKWDSPAVELMETLRRHMEQGEISAKFPYALAALLKPYALKGRDVSMHGVIMEEVKTVLSRQAEKLRGKEGLSKIIGEYLDSAKEHLEDFINLFLAEAFIGRDRSRDDEQGF